MRDYSVRGFLIGAIATALYVTGYIWAALIWGIFGVLFLALATIWETIERRQVPPPPRRASGKPLPPSSQPRTPEQAPDLPPTATSPPPDKDGHGPRPAD